jgi:ABC-2 type transport system permease protein
MDIILIKSIKKSPVYAYFLKELRVLLRTPAYLTNCVGVNFIWPIFVYAVYKLKGINYNLEQFTDVYRRNEGNVQIIILLIIVGISVLLTALNSISSNSFSREGKHFSFIKYIPLSYKVQWHIKALVGAMWAGIGILVYIIPVGCICKIPFIHMIIYVVLSLLAICILSYIGIYIDSIQPKLIWEDELGSLRENYNTFFTMAVAIGIVVILCIAGYVGIKKGTTLYSLSGIIGIVSILGAVCVYGLCKNAYVKNIENQEEV